VEETAPDGVNGSQHRRKWTVSFLVLARFFNFAEYLCRLRECGLPSG
jgi:hypothetical protein